MTGAVRWHRSSNGASPPANQFSDRHHPQNIVFRCFVNVVAARAEYFVNGRKYFTEHMLFVSNEGFVSNVICRKLQLAIDDFLEDFH